MTYSEEELVARNSSLANEVTRLRAENAELRKAAAIIRTAVLAEVVQELSRMNQAWEPIHQAREDCIAAVEVMKEPA